MRKVAFIMGIPISIDIANAENESAIEDAFDRLREIDETFSTYKPSSEISRFQRGLIRESNLSRDVRTTKKAIELFEKMTDGYFSAYFDGLYDPTGYIKGWAIRQAADVLQANGVTTYLINAAGDILASSDSQKDWNIGLQNPFSRQESLGIVSLKNGAVATSGTYERGNHIIDPYTGKAAHSLISATVCGPDIITADVFATTCIAMGAKKALDFINGQAGYEALLIDTAGVTMTSRDFSLVKTQTAQ